MALRNILRRYKVTLLMVLVFTSLKIHAAVRMYKVDELYGWGHIASVSVESIVIILVISFLVEHYLGMKVYG